MSEEKQKGKLFPKPAGPAKRRWCNTHASTDGPILCELCGTDHPEDEEEGYIWDRFLGLQLVEDCCGHAIDILYKEFGEEFATAFLYDFAKDPTNPRFGVLRTVLENCLKTAYEESEKLARETAVLAEKLADI